MSMRLLLAFALLALAACAGTTLPTSTDPGVITWEAHERPLGRGFVLARNSLRDGDDFVLRLEPADANGAQFRTPNRFGTGSFAADIRCARAPGSICAFFLYEDESDDSDEIDIEIFNDGTRRALLNAWVAGELVNQAEVVLPFDPATGFHDYTIDHRPDLLTFSADGTELARFTDRLPGAPMKVMLNAWWPKWLSGPVPTSERVAAVERVTW